MPADRMEAIDWTRHYTRFPARTAVYLRTAVEIWPRRADNGDSRGRASIFARRRRQGDPRMTRTLLTVTFALAICGCESFHPVEAPAEQIQRRIVSEGLLAPGDEVRLVTEDGNVHEFRIAAVDVNGGHLTGKRERVRIEDIATLEKRELSWIKTGILIGGLVLGIFGTECEDECDEYGGFMCC